MFTHVVMYSLKEEYKDLGYEARDMFLTMKSHIDYIVSVNSYLNLTKTNRSFDFILIVKFNNQDDFNKYKIDPYHVNTVKPLIHKLKDKSYQIDYEE